MESLIHVVAAAFVGVGATVVLDIYALLLQQFFGVPMTNWAMVGRWVGLMPRGRFVQPCLAQADMVSGELALGWVVHYLIGAGYGLALAMIYGVGWFLSPSLGEPVLLSLVLLVLPFFVMMPGMGMGIAASRTPTPNIARFKSVLGHSVFGVGMYLSAILVAPLLELV